MAHLKLNEGNVFTYLFIFDFQETHILHPFNRDLYGLNLKVCILGYLRPEMNFSSLEALIAAIQNDISETEKYLDEPEYIKWKNCDFFALENNNDNSFKDKEHTIHLNGKT